MIGDSIIYRTKTIIVAVFVCVLLPLTSGCSGSAGDSYDTGMELFETGKYSEACEAFQTAISKNSDMAEYYIGYGMSLLGMGEYDKAREQFISVMRDTDNKIVRENNKQATRGIALSYYKSGVYDQAKAYFETALKNKELEELNPDIKAYLANCEMFLNNYDGAVKYWNDLIDNNSKASDRDYSQYYLGRAKAETIMGNFKPALEDFQHAIDKDEYCYPAYIGLYLALIESHDTEAATKVLDTSLALEEKNDNDSYYKAILTFYKGDYESAQKGLEAAVEKEQFEAYYYLGQIKQAQKDYSGAIELYNQYLAKCPGGKSAEYCNQMAGCLIELERYEEAGTWLSQGITIAAGSVRKQMMFNEVIVYEKNADYDTAKAKAQAYLEEFQDEKMLQEYEFIKTRSREAK